ncbi:S-layer homology domain-containing protein [Cohnella sp. OV330]|uniref:NHL domain-containing protein n=1 Tax=Cohnella sp. OV330 TaxID=1855288 RepID=UPI001160B23C|nr:S-layer homology domain-containing protein [Cohnella sp. OV330]
MKQRRKSSLGDIFKCLMAFMILVGAAEGLGSGTASAAKAPIGFVAGSYGVGQATDVAQNVTAMAMNHDYIYLSDLFYHVIRRIDRSTQQEVVYAGNGVDGYSGDGGPAKEARVGIAYGLALNASGDLYISEIENNRVRKIDAATGIITTVVGTGAAGFDGDGGPAGDAELNKPKGLAFDASGNLYIADSQNLRVRKVDTAGDISTYAGVGNIAVALDNAPATDIILQYPSDVAVDASGNVYIATVSDHKVWKVKRIGSVDMMSTFAGDSSSGYAGDGGDAKFAKLYRPLGVATDSDGNVYIADSTNKRIRKVDITGNITTFAGGGVSVPGDGGAATDAGFDTPIDIQTSAGDVYFTATDNRLRMVDNSGILSTVAGNGTTSYSGDGRLASTAQLGNVYAMAMDTSGNLFYADTENNRIRRIDAAGIVTTIAGTDVAGFFGDGGPAAAAQLTSPTGIALDAAGNLYIADSGNQRIRKIDANGVISTIAGNGTQGYSGDGGPATAAAMNAPIGVALDPQGNLFVSELTNHVIRKIGTDGIVSTVAGDGTAGFAGDGGSAAAARLKSPVGVAADAAGNVYFADLGNLRIRKIDTNGNIRTIGGTGLSGDASPGGAAVDADLGGPTGIAVNAIGDVYFTDSTDHRIRKITPDGILINVAGDGTAGNSGDGGMSDLAKLSMPYAVALGTDRLYLSTYVSPPAAPGGRLRYVELESAAAPAITQDPADTGANVGDGVTLSAKATISDAGTLGYQWYSNGTDSNSGGTPIAGATGDTYTPPTGAVGTKYYYAVAVNTNNDLTGASKAYAASQAAAVTVSAGGPAPSTPTPTPPGICCVQVIVNGKAEQDCASRQTVKDGRTVVVAKVNEQRLAQRIADAGDRPIVVISICGDPDAAIADLSAGMAKTLEEKNATLTLRTPKAFYTLSVPEIGTASLTASLGAASTSEGTRVQIEIAKATAEQADLARRAASGEEFTILASPFSYAVRAVFGDKQAAAPGYDHYVQQGLALPDSIDPAQVTTSLVLASDGTARHVPTKLESIDGVTYVVARSLADGTNAVVRHPRTFADLAGYWALPEGNDMGSRMIVFGDEKGLFQPKRDITRAEFAAMIARGLGLRPVTGDSQFRDVGAADWFAGEVNAAAGRGLIVGYEDGTFRPQAKITREEAIAIVGRAIELTGLEAAKTPAEGEALLSGYRDATKVSSWAHDRMIDSLRAGLVNGRSASLLAPQSPVTRSEVAALIRRLLRNSELIS